MEALAGRLGSLDREALKGRWLQGNWDLGGLQHTVLLHRALHLYLYCTHTALSLSPAVALSYLQLRCTIEASTEHALTLTSLPRSCVTIDLCRLGIADTAYYQWICPKWTFEKCNFYLYMFQTVSCLD